MCSLVAYCCVFRIGFLGEFDPKWFTEEHYGDAKERNQHQDTLKGVLTLKHVGLAITNSICVLEHHHVDEVDENRRSARRTVFFV